MTVYHFNTELTEGRNKGKTVQEVFDKHPDFIFNTIKKWAINGVNDKTFDDEVLAAAHITKNEHPHKIYKEEYYEPRDKECLKPVKKLKKENKSIDEIFDEMEAERFKLKDVDDRDEKSDESKETVEEKPE